MNSHTALARTSGFGSLSTTMGLVRSFSSFSMGAGSGLTSGSGKVDEFASATPCCSLIYVAGASEAFPDSLSISWATYSGECVFFASKL